MNKTANSNTQSSRQQVAAWIHAVLSDVPVSVRAQELAKGVIYCRILNHYFPGIIMINRIIWSPKSEYENMLNLRILQNAMAQMKISVPIDPIRLSKEKLNDNWTFAGLLFRYLTQSHEDTYSTNGSHEQKQTYGYYPSIISPGMVPMYPPKRSLEQLYPDNFYQNMGRQPFFQLDHNVIQHNSNAMQQNHAMMQQKSFYNASKYSVGKNVKENAMVQMSGGSPNKGKWSVNSHMFQNNLAPIIDRIKQILLKSSHDTERIRQIKMLLNIPLNQQVVVKVEDDDNNQIITISNGEGVSRGLFKSQKKDDDPKAESEKEGKEVTNESTVQTGQQLRL